MYNTSNITLEYNNSLTHFSRDTHKSQDFVFPSDSNIKRLDSSYKIYCSGQPRGFTVNASISHNERNGVENRDTNESGNLVGQITERSQGNEINGDQELHAQQDKVHEKKQKLLYTRRAANETNGRSCKPAKFRSYSDCGIRKQSFIGWKSDCILPVWMFAMAGFFYKGFADITACFYCGLVHRRWRKDDDPIKIHLELQPECSYITELIDKGIQSCEDLRNDMCKENDDVQDVGRETKNLSNVFSTSRSYAASTDTKLLCKVCLASPLQITIQPCGHLATCESCCRRLKHENNRCPICRGQINDTVKTYLTD